MNRGLRPDIPSTTPHPLVSACVSKLTKHRCWETAMYGVDIGGVEHVRCSDCGLLHFLAGSSMRLVDNTTLGT